MMKLSRLSQTIALVLLSAVAGCASQKSTLHDSHAADGRIMNSPKEKIAAMPAIDPSVDPDNQNQRFGIEEARERREAARQKQADRSRCVDVVSGKDAKTGAPCPSAQK